MRPSEPWCDCSWFGQVLFVWNKRLQDEKWSTSVGRHTAQSYEPALSVILSLSLSLYNSVCSRCHGNPLKGTLHCCHPWPHSWCPVKKKTPMIVPVHKPRSPSCVGWIRWSQEGPLFRVVTHRLQFTRMCGPEVDYCCQNDSQASSNVEYFCCEEILCLKCS